jgi:hypothetical protein
MGFAVPTEISNPEMGFFGSKQGGTMGSVRVAQLTSRGGHATLNMTQYSRRGCVLIGICRSCELETDRFFIYPGVTRTSTTGTSIRLATTFDIG